MSKKGTRERKKGTTKQKTTKWRDCSHLSITNLNANSLNSPIKRQSG